MCVRTVIFIDFCQGVQGVYTLGIIKVSEEFVKFTKVLVKRTIYMTYQFVILVYEFCILFI